jgi:hypothetical protein
LARRDERDDRPPDVVVPSAGGRPPERPASPLDASTWGALLVLGLILFLGGVYLGFGAAGYVPSSIRGYAFAAYLPFALTIPGGALAAYAYEEWYQARKRASPSARARALRDLPSFEHFVPPPRRGAP